MCQAGFISDGAGGWNPIVTVKNVSGIQVSSAGSVWCPLIRDQSTSSTQVSQVVIETTNNNGGSISCFMFSQQEDGSGGTFDSTPSVLLSGAGFLEFNMDTSNFNTTSGQEGSYVAACSLGVGDVIHHVYVVEDNAGD